MLKPNLRNKKIYIPLIIVLSLVVVGGAIACGIIFQPRKEREKTVQDWLNDFENSLSVIEYGKIDAINPPNCNVVRSIEIREKEAVIVQYRQALQIYRNSEDGYTAYLTIEETYPTLETREFDVKDEYFFNGDFMYTMRENDGDVFTARFDSDISVLMAVAAENFGKTTYNFSEENFEGYDGAELISHVNGVDKFTASVKPEKYRDFFGKEADIDGVSNVRLEMEMKEEQFQFLALYYSISGQDSIITIESFSSSDIATPDWVS